MVWSKLYLTAVVLLIFTYGFSQIGENRYLVYFEDKVGTPYSVDNPEAFLSERAIQRRLDQNISITTQDLPVNPAYIQGVLNLGEVEFLYSLKWFNAILIETQDSEVIEAIQGLDEVTGVEISPVIHGEDYPEIGGEIISLPKDDSEYGPSLNQIDMINGLPLHNAGFKGEGKWVGVFDGGFSYADQVLALNELIGSDRLLGGKNFVDGTDEVYLRSTHGTYVLSTMAGMLEDSLIGTGPEASYFLAITEDVSQERRIEEAFWAIAAEYSDSIGIDIINTSLGYTQFDVEEENHTYESLDGNTTLITRAADIAASKGILCVTSAGNSGNSSWFYISAPADADSVLAVGAVQPDGAIASFSSRGPRVDGAVKPNVVAQGQATVISDISDGIQLANGTSFSSPVVAGMSASLWQAVPQATAHQVFQAIEESANLYNNPNDSLGYGIPDFGLALEILQTTTGTLDREAGSGDLLLFPNPFEQGNMLNFILPAAFGERLVVRIYDITGKEIFNKPLNAYSGKARIQSMPDLNQGVYIVNLQNESGEMSTSKLLVR